MDPISAILAAILAGATAAAGDVVKDEVKNAYTALRNRIRSLFGDDSRVEDAVAIVEQAPALEPAADNLSKALQAGKADEDDELVSLANQVLAAAKDQPYYENVIEAASSAQVRRSGISTSAPVQGEVINKVKAGEGAVVEDSGISIGPPQP